MKNSKNCVNLVFWSFVAPPGLSPDQIGHSKQKTGTLSFDTPKYMKIPNSQSWIHPISCTSPQMGSHQKFHSLNKLISKNFFSKIKILTHPYKSYVTIKNMFSHQISHIIMYSPLFWVLGVTLLRLLRCTNMVHFASSKEHSALATCGLFKILILNTLSYVYSVFAIYWQYNILIRPKHFIIAQNYDMDFIILDKSLGVCRNRGLKCYDWSNVFHLFQFRLWNLAKRACFSKVRYALGNP